MNSKSVTSTIMLYSTIFTAALVAASCIFKGQEKEIPKSQKGNEVMVINAPAKSIYEFQVKSIDGTVIDFSNYRGMKMLIVNTASKCGYTKQYEALEKLSRQYAGKLVVVGCPSDNFGGQEFEKDEETADFCKKNFGVTFPLSSRMNVIGPQADPLFKFLSQRSENGVMDAKITWNFCKFLIDENGRVSAFFPSKVVPDSEEITGKL